MTPTEMAANGALYNAEAESCALGGIAASIQRGQGGEIYAIREDDFFAGESRMIYRALRTLHERRTPTDLITLTEELRRLYPGANVEEAAIDAVVNGSRFMNTGAYIAMVKETATRRRMIELAEKMIAGAADRTQDAAAAMEDARGSLRRMTETGGGWASMADVFSATYDDIEKRFKGEIKGIKSGVETVDRATGGFFPGELAIVAARPAVGKSAFALQTAMRAATDGYKVMFVSCEMIDSQFGQRLISNRGNIDGMKLRNAKLDEGDWERIVDVMSDYSGLPIRFAFGSQTVEEIRAEVQNMAEQEECDLLVVDYLQKMRTKKRFERDHERVAYISGILKEITTDLKIPVVALAQVKRQTAYTGKARCPGLEELKDSGSIEQDADTVIFLHRPDDSSDPSIDGRDEEWFDKLQDAGWQYIVFSIAKQRQGQTGLLGAAFDPSHMRYMTMDGIRRSGLQA